MDTFLGLLVGNSLTRLVFFPTIAAVPLFFFAADARQGGEDLRAGRLADRARLRRSSTSASHLGAGRRLPAGARRGPDGGLIPWIAELRHPLRPRHRRHLDAAGAARRSSWCRSCSSARGRGSSGTGRCSAPRMLLLTTGVLGALLAYDLFLFYVFWEVMLVPMYLLIGIWGGERRIYAAVKFFLYTMAGSLLMLVAILWMAWTFQSLNGGVWSFAYADLLRLDLPRAPADLAVRGLRADLRHQGADVPVPHLAARRPRRGAHGRLGDPRRHPAEARHLRLPALRPAALPARQPRRRSRCCWRSPSSASSTARWSPGCRRT